LSPNQRAAIETVAGRKLQVASADERQHAADRMRYQLYLLDPSERRMSIEDCAAALLEKSEMPA
jgi:hypothetical protein